MNKEKLSSVQQTPGLSWYRCKHMRIGEGFARRNTEKTRTYNILNSSIWDNFVNCSEDINKALSFINRYGLLGLGGWYYGAIKQASDTAESDFYFRRKPREMPGDVIVDIGSDGGMSGTEITVPPNDSWVRNRYYFENSDLNNDFPTKEPIREFFVELRRAKLLNAVILSLDSNILNEERFKNAISAWRELDLSSNIRNYSNTKLDKKRFISDALKVAIAGVQPTITDNLEWFYSYQPSPLSLLPFIYLSLYFNLTKNNWPRLCASKTCNNTFSSLNKLKIYCSEACKNAEKQRQYRLRAKEVKKDGKRSGSKKT